jgi:TRAP-type transport system periplasmic protein
MKRMWLIPVILVLSLTVFAGGTAETPTVATEDPVVIKLGHSGTLDGLHGIASTKFKELAESYSNGRIEVQIYPNNQLGGEQEMFQGARVGTLEMTDGAVNNLTPFAPAVGFLSFPYMFETQDQAYTILDGDIGQQLKETVIDQAGVRILGFLEGGFRVLTNSRRPVRNIGDLEGLKIRVPGNEIMIDTWKAFGINPTPLPWPETFTALQQRTVDGQENPYWVIWEENFNEVQKYVTEVRYLMWLGPLVIGENFFQTLPEDLQDIVVRAGREAVDHQRSVMTERNEQFRRELIERGMEMIEPEDEDEWIRRAKSIWPKFYESIGGRELVDKIEEIKKSM